MCSVEILYLQSNNNFMKNIYFSMPISNVLKSIFVKNV